MILDGSSEVKMPFEMFSRLHMLLRDVSNLLPAEQRVLAEDLVIDMDGIYSKMDMSPLIMKGDPNPGKVLVQDGDNAVWVDEKDVKPKNYELPPYVKIVRENGHTYYKVDQKLAEVMLQEEKKEGEDHVL